MSVKFSTPNDMTISIAQQLQTKRLAQNLSQKSLAERSGVSEIGTASTQLPRIH